MAYKTVSMPTMGEASAVTPKTCWPRGHLCWGLASWSCSTKPICQPRPCRGNSRAANPRLLPTAYAPAWLPPSANDSPPPPASGQPLTEAWHAGKVTPFNGHLNAPTLIGPRTILTMHDLIIQSIKRLYRTGKTPTRSRLER